MEPAKFRQTMAQFATGVTVVTAGRIADAGGAHGMTCNSFSSISSHDATISVCLTRNTRTSRLIAATGVFAVNVLSADQQHIADRFAGRHKDYDERRFEGIACTVGDAHGTPLIERAKACLQCEVDQLVEFGDHTLFIARVVRAAVADTSPPLIFYHSGYHSLST